MEERGGESEGEHSLYSSHVQEGDNQICGTGGRTQQPILHSLLEYSIYFTCKFTIESPVFLAL